MKKKIIIAIIILLVIALLCPIPMRLKDGGTVKYQALLYSVSNVHRLAPSTEGGYEVGLIIEILGMQVFNNVKCSGEKQRAIAAHVFLDGKGYFYNGSITYELPEGYEYAGDVINVGNTFSGKDFEGNVDGKIYMNKSVTDTAYFSWVEWNEEADGPAPFLKLEVKTDEEMITAPVEVLYYRNGDGTWSLDGITYKYMLEISGRMPNSANDITFVYLSNLESITFEQAWKAAGYSSNTEDYFDVKDAVFVEAKNGIYIN